MNSVLKFRDYIDKITFIIDTYDSPEKVRRNVKVLIQLKRRSYDKLRLLENYANKIEESILNDFPNIEERRRRAESITSILCVKRKYGTGNYLTPIDYNIFDKNKNEALYNEFYSVLDNNVLSYIKQHSELIDADIAMSTLYNIAKTTNDNIVKVKKMLDCYSVVSSFEKSNTSVNEKREVCLQSIIEHINNNLSCNLHKSVADVVMLIGYQIRLYINSIGTVEYLNYIERHIQSHPNLNIYGYGNPILDKAKEGNLFFAIDYLRMEFEELPPNDGFGESYYFICDKYAQFITAVNYSTIYRVGRNPEMIYYNLWDNLLPPENVSHHGWYIEYLAKARYNPDRNLHVTSIQVNNDYFVEYLESWKQLKKGWSFYVYELQFMMEDYAKRKSIICADDIASIKLDWLYNTLNLCDDKYKMVQRWCEEQIDILKRNGNATEIPESQLLSSSGKADDDVTPSNTSTFMVLMLLDSDEQKQKLLATLHSLIVGKKKKGKYVALVFLICEKYGLISKPTHNLLTPIFGEIGSKSGYNNYFKKGLSVYTDTEIMGIEEHILPFVNGH